MYIGRRNVEGGGRQDSFANNSFRAVAGVRGAISDAWGYDVSAQYSSVSANTSTLNFLNKDHLSRALDVIDVGGTPTCRSVVDGSDPACVPWNVFVPGGVTPNQLAYLQANGLQIGRLNQEIYNGIITGDLGVHGIKSPLAADGIQLVFGSEYRRDTMNNDVDSLQESDKLAGAGGALIGIGGAVTVNELFMEARVPIAQDQAFAESLSFDTAYRYSDYDTGVQTDTYKFGLEWAPVSDVRLRATYQRAVRAANIVELFTAQGFNLFDSNGDPCGAADRDPNASDAECIATGVPAAQVGSPALDSPANQYQYLQGGNTGLEPETADTYTYGIVLQPRFAPGLAITIDYFDISIDDTISTFGAINTWTACYTNNDADACGRIRRNPNGQLWVGDGNVVDTNINIGTKSTKGYDINIGYTGLEIGRFGSLSFNLTGTLIDELITEPGPGFAPYDCAGHFSSVCDEPKPEWRHRFRTSWQTPWDLDLSATWRFYDEVEGLTSANNPLPEDQIDRVLGAESYFDLAANWAFTDKASVMLGINNLLDDNPGVSGSVGTTGNGNTFPQTYDALGRYVFLRATVDF